MRRSWPRRSNLMRRGIDLVQHLDPAGVGARDLRECLALQIAAQQQEFDHLYGQALAEISQDADDPHGSLQAEAEAKIDERRRAWKWRR